MWDFNIRGDLYFEKTVDGFLSELFEKWKYAESSHEVTIVLFSRCIYEAKTKTEFPEMMRSCIQESECDGGLFYEDFYRVLVQNERFEDWNPILGQLRRMFTDYKRSILEYHSVNCDLSEIPPNRISVSSQGNFLEVLNMSLNTFGNHYQNRSLDRTGQQSIVITPGVGMFEVDKEMALMTKQRIIDSGVGSDLICIGEQPLHAVPLLKFHSKNQSTDFNMPHWINLSFYTSKKRDNECSFVPRIKIPAELETDRERKPFFQKSKINSWIDDVDELTEEVMDEWDKRLFYTPKPPNRINWVRIFFFFFCKFLYEHNKGYAINW